MDVEDVIQFGEVGDNILYSSDDGKGWYSGVISYIDKQIGLVRISSSDKRSPANSREFLSEEPDDLYIVEEEFLQGHVPGPDISGYLGLTSDNTPSKIKDMMDWFDVIRQNYIPDIKKSTPSNIDWDAASETDETIERILMSNYPQFSHKQFGAFLEMKEKYQGD
jgi:hypothetical protein